MITKNKELNIITYAVNDILIYYFKNLYKFLINYNKYSILTS